MWGKGQPPQPRDRMKPQEKYTMWENSFPSPILREIFSKWCIDNISLPSSSLLLIVIYIAAKKVTRLPKFCRKLFFARETLASDAFIDWLRPWVESYAECLHKRGRERIPIIYKSSELAKRCLFRFRTFPPLFEGKFLTSHPIWSLLNLLLFLGTMMKCDPPPSTHMQS